MDKTQLIAIGEEKIPNSIKLQLATPNSTTNNWSTNQWYNITTDEFKSKRRS